MLHCILQRRLDRITLQVSLDIGPEIVAIVGPSGSGKSMTLKTLAGIEALDSGRITLDHQLLFDSEQRLNLPPQLRRVGYVPQQAALFPHLSALDNVAFPLRFGQGLSRSAARRQALEFLARVNLAEVADARPAHISGGQQQRVALARALATRPRLLLLDEPFGALDPPVRAELGEALRQLQAQEQIPVLFVTHDLQEAATLATQVAVLIDGSLRQMGSGRDILTRPADRDVALLTRARNILPGKVQSTVDGSFVRTAIGDVPLRSSGEAVVSGGLVDVVIRPEAWRLDAPDARFDLERFVCTGTLLEIRDHGLSLLLRVAVGETVLEVLRPYGADPTGVGGTMSVVGAPVVLSATLDDVHLLPVAQPEERGAG